MRALIFLLGCLTAIESRAEDEFRGERFVVLKNGEVLRGRVEKNRRFYSIEQNRSTLRVPRAQVQLVARQMRDVYEHQARRMPGNRAADHLSMAEWCLNQDMTSFARQHLEKAAEIDPMHPQLSGLRERYERRVQRSHATNPTGATQQRDARGPNSKAIANGRSEDRTTLVAPEELVSLHAESPLMMDLFCKAVQPALLKSCAAARCHGHATSTSFRLRSVPGTATSRRTTMANLAAALAWVDHERPDESPLLYWARRPHGTKIKSRGLGEKKEALATWLALIPVALGDPANLPSHGSRVVQAGYTSETVGDSPQQQPQRTSAVDPFDPREFNDRYGPHSGKAEASADETSSK